MADMTQVLTAIGEEGNAPLTHLEACIGCADCSISMKKLVPGTNQSKAAQALQHLFHDQNSLVARLKTGKNRDSYLFSLVTFDRDVDVKPLKPLGQVTPEDFAFDPFSKHQSGGTAIGTALHEAGLVAKQFLAESDGRLDRLVNIFLFSDGMESVGTNPIEEAEEIKAFGEAHRALGRPGIIIITAAYGDDADEDTLRRIASTGPEGDPLFRVVRTGQELRDFVVASNYAVAPGRAIQ